MNEEWRPVVGFPGYEVSDYGNVRSWWKHGGAEGDWSPEPTARKAVDNSNGYLYVQLRLNKKRTNRYIHRLVLEAFVGTCPSGHEGAHLDGDKTNNHVGNLKWVVHVENCAHRIKHGTQVRGTRCWNSTLTESQVKEIRRLRGAAYTDIAKRFSVSRNTVSRVLNNQTWRHVT